MKRIPKAVWLPAVTLLYLAAWALILLIPSLGLPAVPADGWAEALEAHVRDAGGLTVTGRPRGLVLLLLLEGAVGVLLRLRRKADGAAAPPQENP